MNRHKRKQKHMHHVQQPLRGRTHLVRMVPIIALLLTIPFGKLHASDQHRTQTNIRIASHGWGTTPSDDLKLVLESVAKEFGQHFPNSAPPNVDVRPGESGPVVLYERNPDGSYVVKLSARDARWFQFVYQFAHELCHIYSNFDNKLDSSGSISTRNQWFEESVCEAASLFALKSLAQVWTQAPTGSLLARHAADLRAYAEYFLQESHRRLPPTKTLSLWYRINQHHLASNPYHRRRNELVANVLLPYFERNPRNWEAIAYLNPDAEHADMVFERYLDEWHDACPEELKEVVERVIANFNGAPTLDTARSNAVTRQEIARAATTDPASARPARSVSD